MDEIIKDFRPDSNMGASLVHCNAGNLCLPVFIQVKCRTGADSSVQFIDNVILTLVLQLFFASGKKNLFLNEGAHERKNCGNVFPCHSPDFAVIV